MKQLNSTKTAIALLTLTLVASAPIAAATYTLDTNHTEIQFRVRHLGISSVTGQFGTFSGTLVLDPEALEAGSVEVEIDAASIDTGVEARDEHLRSADFFNVAEHPAIRFESTEVKSEGDGLQVLGNLTISGITRPVVLDAEFNGSAVDPWGKSRVGFSARTEISREDFGLTWNKVLESGGFLVGDEIQITLEVQGIEQSQEAAAP